MSRQPFLVSAAMCALLAAVFVARYRFAPYPVEAPFEGGMPMAAALVRFTTAHPWWAAGAAALLVGWTALVVMQLAIKYAPAASRNYLPPQIFLIAAGGIAVPSEALAVMAAAWLMALAVRQLAFSLRKGYRFTEVFHAGFYLGLTPLFYAPLVLAIVPVAAAGLSIYRRSGREAIVCAAGLMMPVPMAGFVHWAMGADGGFIYRELWRCCFEGGAGWGVGQGGVPWLAIVPAAAITALAAMAFVRVAAGRKSIRRTQYRFIAHMGATLLCVGATAALPGAGIGLAAMAAVPCAVTVPYAFAGGAGRSPKAAAWATAIYAAAILSALISATNAV